jgi:hypothetical protein
MGQPCNTRSPPCFTEDVIDGHFVQLRKILIECACHDKRLSTGIEPRRNGRAHPSPDASSTAWLLPIQAAERWFNRKSNSVHYTGEIHASAFDDIGNTIKHDLSSRPEPIIIDDKLTPYASQAIRDVENRIAQLQVQNRASPYPQSPRQNIVGINLEGVDQMRRRLSAMRRDAYSSGNAADGRATQAVLDAFDDHIDRAVNGGFFNGDPRAVNAWNDARAAYSDYRKTFTGSNNDRVGKVIDQITGRAGGDAAIPNAVADFIHGSSGKATTLNVGVASRIKGIPGEQSPEWTGVKQGLFSRLTETPQNVTDWGSARMANSLGNFLNGKGRELAQAIYSPAERQMLQSYADMLQSSSCHRREPTGRIPLLYCGNQSMRLTAR